jgi:glycosyltransferase involved in cell wall biosynthesis
MVAMLAWALAPEHRVDVLHHLPGLSAERLAEISGTDLGGVRLRYFEPEPDPSSSRRDPRLRYDEARRWHAALSRGYDLFVAVVHGRPPFCHAPRGALVVLFPAYASFFIQPQSRTIRLKSALRQPPEHFYQKWEWRKRLEGYQVRTAISEFSREWTRRRWNFDCEILYPPVDIDFRRADKSDTVLSVGRFVLPGDGHTKKQGEMLDAFRRMKDEGLAGWEFVCAGALKETAEYRAHFDGLRRLGAEFGARVVANLGRDELKRLYERSKIFWHATGYGEREESRPELSEHFGIATAEAMAAGCVPVVINKGGQREIVEHEVNGFLWDTLEELKEYTARLAGDEQLRARMSEAARERASFFGPEEFVRRVRRLLRPLLG